MACLIAPATAAIITTAAGKKIPASYHAGWLVMMLWGGVLMLVVDHLMTGEIVPYPPFFTTGIEKIMSEVLLIGVPMTLTVTAVWIGMLILSSKVRKTAFNGKSL
jgi:hypothetical protein